MFSASVPLLYSALAVVIAALISAGVIWLRANRQVKEYRHLSEALSEIRLELERASSAFDASQRKLEEIDKETKQLQALKNNADKLAKFVQISKKKAAEYKTLLAEQEGKIEEGQAELGELMGSLDLYSRLDDYTQVGHFDMPDYLYETSERFQIEIKAVRDKQRDLIRGKSAVVYPNDIEIRGEKAFDKRVLNGQTKLLLTTFNIKCDFLIGKVNPGNYPRTLEQIEKQANTLEKLVADLSCGLSADYVELKFQECRLQYQFKLKKQEEQEEQRLIREQMREEERARREYEAAVRKAEEEERIYREMLEKARQQLELAAEDDRQAAESRISALEAQLAEAEAKGVRAKSLAEQTRRGHVYVISNIGSFGDGIYKIGLTRRLEPMDRVKELGDASVPFTFDVHAIIFSEDAPAMESELHRRFTHHRVNAVNLRKEFFRVSLKQIKQAVEELAGSDAGFRMTVVAEEYFETRRLRETAGTT